eukprot:764529-Hanusia_phi.AAC.10
MPTKGQVCTQPSRRGEGGARADRSCSSPCPADPHRRSRGWVHANGIVDEEIDEELFRCSHRCDRWKSGKGCLRADRTMPSTADESLFLTFFQSLIHPTVIMPPEASELKDHRRRLNLLHVLHANELIRGPVNQTHIVLQAAGG